MGTYIIGGMFAVVVGFALYKSIKQAKSGGCSGCSGGCSSSCNLKK